MSNLEKEIKTLTKRHEIRIHDSFHELIDGIVLKYTEQETVSPDLYRLVFRALLEVKGVSMERFASHVKLPEEVLMSWSDGKAEPDIEIAKTVLEKFIVYARQQVYPCSPKYQFPDATIFNGWVLPPGVRLQSRLTSLPGWKSLSYKNLSVFKEIGVVTVQEYLEDINAPQKVLGVGSTRSNDLRRWLLINSGFRKVDTKLLM